jgi:hypothetical protein
MDPTVVVHDLRTDSIGRLNETKFKYSFKTKTFLRYLLLNIGMINNKIKTTVYAASLHVG